MVQQLLFAAIPTGMLILWAISSARRERQEKANRMAEIFREER